MSVEWWAQTLKPWYGGIVCIDIYLDWAKIFILLLPKYVPFSKIWVFRFPYVSWISADLGITFSVLVNDTSFCYWEPGLKILYSCNMLCERHGSNQVDCNHFSIFLSTLCAVMGFFIFNQRTLNLCNYLLVHVVKKEVFPKSSY